MESLYKTDRRSVMRPADNLKTILHVPNCFEPAFRKYAKRYSLCYELLQFVVGVPVHNSYQFSHLNITINKVDKIGMTTIMIG